MGNASTSRPDPARHWDDAYEARGTTGVSWFQPETTMSIDQINHLGVARDAAIIDVGGGASLLVDFLIDQRFSDVSVLDVSKSALDATRERIGAGASVTFLHEDLLSWRPARRFDVWHDRAVFHFLVEPGDRDVYLDLLRSALRPSGALIMATFAPNGPEYCSGLPVARYSADDLTSLLGDRFEIVEVHDEQHSTPGGAIQPFTWISAQASAEYSS
jgi:Methyltransferase domain